MGKAAHRMLANGSSVVRSVVAAYSLLSWPYFCPCPFRFASKAIMTPCWLAARAAGRRNGVVGSSTLDRTIPLPSVSEPTCQCLQDRLFPTLPVAIIPWFPPALVTTVSISKPLSTTTKFAVTGGRPSVKLIVKVPVQSEFTV